MKPDMYTVAEVMERWRVSRPTVYRWIKLGYVKSIKRGGVIRIFDQIEVPQDPPSNDCSSGQV